jgi:hypothetical protein
MTPYARKHLSAWLGLAAMWLIVLAPLVSQLIAAPRSDNPAEGVLCSAVQAARSATSTTALHDHADGLAACGYCDLLAGHAALPPAPVALPVLFLLVATAVVALSSRHIPFGAFLSARPRAPPALLRPLL